MGLMAMLANTHCFSYLWTSECVLFITQLLPEVLLYSAFANIFLQLKKGLLRRQDISMHIEWHILYICVPSCFTAFIMPLIWFYFSHKYADFLSIYTTTVTPCYIMRQIVSSRIYLYKKIAYIKGQVRIYSNLLLLRISKIQVHYANLKM